MTPRAVLTTLLPLLLGLVAAPAHAQEEDGPWTVSGELGASLFFGNTEQVTLTSLLGGELADSARALAVDARFTYGEARGADGDDFVIKRSWHVGLTYAHQPFQRWSPFALAEMESSFEKRIEQRYNLGGGATYTFDRAPSRRADLSLALLAERTNPADVPAAAGAGNDLLARWSARLRARRTFDEDRLTLQHETSYRPRFSEPSDFTLATTTSASFELNDVVALKLTFVDNYDSEAVGRGARTNNDGQLVLSVLSSFE